MRRCNAFPQNITEIWKLQHMSKHVQHRSKHVQHRDKRMRHNIMLLEYVSFVLILPNVQVMLNKMQPIVRLTDRNDLPEKYLGDILRIL